ncbi:MBL fold metallo-hydrolase [Alkalicaulis satelles]|uniref:MBL fold metallo-hydrolase n=2 Tax=Alkalicaulis satelles TaxID=2609175 RepID=A0A5M6ZT22_9PROT|nr:MBL fold metallo-hydrolase [Alkalicaulis satelles]
MARNPGPFTYTGTGVFIIGAGEVAVIDPGPALPEHAAALDAALEGERVTHVLVTHHHADHSPLARPLARKHGCKVYGMAPRALPDMVSTVQMEAGDDSGFRPDVEIADGDEVSGPGWTLRALHTPGHTSNHVCYGLTEENTLFSGDHVMGWSTSVVVPPDGRMGDYIASLERVRAENFALIRPTHGPAIDKPRSFLSAYIGHRRARERQILAHLANGPQRIRDLVAAMYAQVDARLHPAAAMSVLAHMIHLIEQGKAACEGPPGLDSVYALP